MNSTQYSTPELLAMFHGSLHGENEFSLQDLVDLACSDSQREELIQLCEVTCVLEATVSEAKNTTAGGDVEAEDLKPEKVDVGD